MYVFIPFVLIFSYLVYKAHSMNKAYAKQSKSSSRDPPSGTSSQTSSEGLPSRPLNSHGTRPKGLDNQSHPGQGDSKGQSSPDRRKLSTTANIKARRRNPIQRPLISLAGRHLAQPSGRICIEICTRPASHILYIYILYILYIYMYIYNNNIYLDLYVLFETGSGALWITQGRRDLLSLPLREISLSPTLLGSLHSYAVTGHGLKHPSGISVLFSLFSLSLIERLIPEVSVSRFSHRP